MSRFGFIMPPWPLDWCVTLCLGHEEDAPALAYSIALTAAPREAAEDRDDPMGERQPTRARGEALQWMPAPPVGQVVNLCIRYPGPIVDRFAAQVLSVEERRRDPATLDRTVDFLVTSAIERRF